MLARARQAGRDRLRLRRRRARDGGRRRGRRDRRRGARRLRHRGRPPPRHRRGDRGALGDVRAAGARAPGGRGSARRGSTTTTTTPPATCSSGLPAVDRAGAGRRAAGRVARPGRPRGRGGHPAARRPPGSAGVIHCFTGGVAEARVYLDLGQHLSFSGIVTFKNAGEHPRGGGLRPARPHPGRDGRPLPGAHPASGRAQRAGLHRRDTEGGGRAARAFRRTSWTPPPARTPASCSDCRARERTEQARPRRYWRNVLALRD